MNAARLGKVTSPGFRLGSFTDPHNGTRNPDSSHNVKQRRQRTCRLAVFDIQLRPIGSHEGKDLTDRCRQNVLMDSSSVLTRRIA